MVALCPWRFSGVPSAAPENQSRCVQKERLPHEQVGSLPSVCAAFVTHVKNLKKICAFHSHSACSVVKRANATAAAPSHHLASSAPAPSRPQRNALLCCRLSGSRTKPLMTPLPSLACEKSALRRSLPYARDLSLSSNSLSSFCISGIDAILAFWSTLRSLPAASSLWSATACLSFFWIALMRFCTSSGLE